MTNKNDRRIDLDFVYLSQDLIEATAPRRRRKGRRRLWLIGGLVVAMMTLLTVVMLLVSTPVVIISGPPPLPPEQDLLLALVPPLVPALMFLMIMAITWLRMTPRKTLIMRLLAGAIFVLFMGAVFGSFALAFIADTIVPWRPTRLDLLLISLAPGVALMIVGLLLMILIGRVIVRRRWQSSLQRPRQMSLDPEQGIWIKDSVLEYRLTWPFFRSARETANLLILTGEDERIYMIPKRAFHSQRELAAAKAMIQARVEKTRFENEDPAFEVVGVGGGKNNVENGGSRVEGT